MTGIYPHSLLEQAEEMFDAASRYLLFPLKRAVADVLLPHLELAPPAELCHWLMLADMYDVLNFCHLKSFMLDSSFWCFLLFMSLLDV